MNPNMEEGMGAAAWLVAILAGSAIATVIAAAIWAIVTRC